MKNLESRPGFPRRLYNRVLGIVYGLPPDLYDGFRNPEKLLDQVEGGEAGSSRKPGKGFSDWCQSVCHHWGIKE